MAVRGETMEAQPLYQVASLSCEAHSAGGVKEDVAYRRGACGVDGL